MRGPTRQPENGVSVGRVGLAAGGGVGVRESGVDGVVVQDAQSRRRMREGAAWEQWVVAAVAAVQVKVVAAVLVAVVVAGGVAGGAAGGVFGGAHVRVV
jgi:hypothetical protein